MSAQTTFERLAPFIQDYIYQNNWTEIRGIQIAACDVIFNTECNLLLSSGTASGKSVDVVFTPHLTPMDRGILSTIYSKPVREATRDELWETLHSFYKNEPFVKIVEHLPATKDVSGTNFVHIAVRNVGNRIITVSAVDNLIKGASGAAIQNFNLMYGYPETTALI